MKIKLLNLSCSVTLGASMLACGSTEGSATVPGWSILTDVEPRWSVPEVQLPVMMAATFGLLHGLGFAGARRELGLPQGAIPLSLFSFNVGIEVGQLAFIAVALVPVALVSSSDSLSRSFRVVSAYVIGALAFYWVFRRIFEG